MQLLVATNIKTVTSCSSALIGFRIKIFRFVFVCCLLSAIIRYTATVKFSCFQVLSAIFAESLVFWVITLCRIMSLVGRVVQIDSGPESLSPFLQMDVVCLWNVGTDLLSWRQVLLFLVDCPNWRYYSHEPLLWTGSSLCCSRRLYSMELLVGMK